MGGGEMIEHVGLDVSTYALPPSRFEPGTPPIAEAIGMGAAAGYLGGLGLQAVRAYEEDIGRYLYERVRRAARAGIFTHIVCCRTGARASSAPASQLCLLHSCMCIVL